MGHTPEMGPDVFGNCDGHTRTNAIVSPSSACTQVTQRSCSDPASGPGSLGLRFYISNGSWGCPGCWPKDHTLRSKDLGGTYNRIKTNVIVFLAPLLFKSPDFKNFTHILIISLLQNNTVHLKKEKETGGERCIKLIGQMPQYLIHCYLANGNKI